MDVIEFVVAASGQPDIGIRINGRGLADLAADVERAFDASLAGSCSGLAPYVVHDIHHHLERPRASWFEGGDTVLLGCDCGEWGCWPLTAKVTVMHSTIRWSGFRNGHRDWDLQDLGPFEFDRVSSSPPGGRRRR